MTLSEFLGKQFIDVIQWNEPQDGILAFRYPMRTWRFRTAASSPCASRRWPRS